MELFKENSERLQTVNYYFKTLILDVWFSSGYACVHDNYLCFVLTLYFVSGKCNQNIDLGIIQKNYGGIWFSQFFRHISLSKHLMDFIFDAISKPTYFYLHYNDLWPSVKPLRVGSHTCLLSWLIDWCYNEIARCGDVSQHSTVRKVSGIGTLLSLLAEQASVYLPSLNLSW